jgi:hypothetical protein
MSLFLLLVPAALVLDGKRVQIYYNNPRIKTKWQKVLLKAVNGCRSSVNGNEQAVISIISA